MKRLLPLLVLLIAAPAIAQTPPLPAEASANAASDPRLLTIRYDPNQVVRLTAATNYQLTVIFSPDERVENVAIGDSEAWQATLNRRGDALFLKPLRSNGATNMTVITSARAYSFELSAIYSPSPDTPFTVRFDYPDGRSQVSAGTASQGEIGRYRLSGSRRLRPSAISDDGVRTYVEWRSEQTLPAIFAIDERGDEVLLDGNMRDGRYVVDAVHPTLLFRLERQTARANRVRPKADR